MFEYTKAELAKKADEMNFVRDTLEKVLRLSDIYEKKEASGIIGVSECNEAN